MSQQSINHQWRWFGMKSGGWGDRAWCVPKVVTSIARREAIEVPWKPPLANHPATLDYRGPEGRQSELTLPES